MLQFNLFALLFFIYLTATVTVIGAKFDPNEKVEIEGDMKNYICKPLRNCNDFIWILKNSLKLNKAKKINKTLFLKIFHDFATVILKDKRCSVDNKFMKNPPVMDTFIPCPLSKNIPEEYYDEHDEQVDYVSDQYEYEYNDETQNEIESSLEDYMPELYVPDVFNDPHEKENEFNGRITLRSASGIFGFSGYSRKCEGSLEISHASLENPLTSIKILRISNPLQRIRRLRKLEQRVIMRIKTDGTCCWRGYNHPFFRGRSLKIDPGYNEIPEFHIKSILPEQC